MARSIIADHVFIDGNKRTGIMIALLLLERNGVGTNSSDQELEDFAVQIAVDYLDVPAIADWLHNHS